MFDALLSRFHPNPAGFLPVGQLWAAYAMMLPAKCKPPLRREFIGQLRHAGLTVGVRRGVLGIAGYSLQPAKALKNINGKLVLA